MISTCLCANIYVTALPVFCTRSRFAQQLKDDVPKLHEQIDETRQTLMNTTIESPEADVEEVTAFLIGCKEAAHHEVELAERFARYQLALGMPITDYEDFDDVKGICS